ncbi:MAG: cytochrome c oxidase subunit I, partial [Merismopedia sp. SIO2A8]|nr:cytochrome c oxidase subunit I [Merismopedia sp. SIO2A8]
MTTQLEKPNPPKDTGQIHQQEHVRRWQDYFTFNTDHKVIGIQYLVTAYVFSVVGGLM